MLQYRSKTSRVCQTRACCHQLFQQKSCLDALNRSHVTQNSTILADMNGLAGQTDAGQVFWLRLFFIALQLVVTRRSGDLGRYYFYSSSLITPQCNCWQQAYQQLGLEMRLDLMPIDRATLELNRGVTG